MLSESPAGDPTPAISGKIIILQHTKVTKNHDWTGQ
jgi:hypothetical protein